MKLPENIVLLDSLGDLKPNNTNPILVCGSHCGGDVELAKFVKSCHVKAVFLNNAGVGKNQAGIRGLSHYNTEGILACAVDNYSAEIGISQDTWESGIISHRNKYAETAGIQIGDSVKEAIAKLANFIESSESLQKDKDIKHQTKKQVKDSASEVDFKKQKQVLIDGVTIVVTDSITFLNENNAKNVVVCGSHGGLSAGHYAMKHSVSAVFFNDAGIGKNSAGVKSLDILSNAGIIACTIDCMSAEIFNGQDVLNNGIISVCNQLASTINIKEKMSVTEAIRLLK